MAQIGNSTVEVGDLLRDTADQREGEVLAVSGDAVRLRLTGDLTERTVPAGRLRYNTWDRKADPDLVMHDEAALGTPLSELQASGNLPETETLPVEPPSAPESAPPAPPVTGAPDTPPAAGDEPTAPVASPA